MDMVVLYPPLQLCIVYLSFFVYSLCNQSFWNEECPLHKCPFGFLSKMVGRNNIQQEYAFVNDAKKESHHFLPGQNELNEQMRMIDLNESDLRLLRQIKPEVERYLDRITDFFYTSVLDVEKLEQIIVKHSTIERLKKTLRDHLLEIFNGDVDEKYISKRLMIAKVHKRVGLEPKWYLSAFQNLQNGFMEILYKEIRMDDEQRLMVIRTITKLLNLEQQLVLEAYEKENMQEQLLEHEKVKNELKNKIAMFSEDLIQLSISTNEAIEQLIASSIEVSGTFQKTSSLAVTSERMAQEGSVQMEELNERISSIYEQTHEMEKNIKELSNASKQIEYIVDSVKEIASQTQMLSLNASIEAARAGEYGKGFGVVAKEVSRLSEDTKQTVVRIAELVHNSQEITSGVVSKIQDVRQLTGLGRQQSSATRMVFSDIVESMKHSTKDIVSVEEQIRLLITTIEGIGSSTSQAAESASRFKTASALL
ncbi:hypothetical protein GRF59_28100 [Paenibacillus sp. HJL G12]|uniref:Methyl-accepting transducer domain-containing protein n=1 Tax=Paenibacillus dendrobii TaxID=2691084 RepID=A0A7X3IPN9_9BACL|nr:globin-coupled sensor protein [Paenibacillus dendrobii]MWV47455.1 hypothetical protein [Paenibacillus dendrobii]